MGRAWTRLPLLALLGPELAAAQPAPSPPASAVRDEPRPTAAPPVPDEPAITIGAYLEAYYQAQLQNASNRITNLRGFDNRSRTLTLSNVALDVRGEHGPVTARVVLQVGATGSTYYLAEPAAPGSDSVNATSGELWKFLQAATVTARLPADVTIEAGLIPSPIGLEVIPVKDNWNWSRSNLFFGLPYYHTGVHVLRPLGGGWTGKLHVYNGWNTVVDSNDSPSAAVSAAYASTSTTAQLLYLGGIERPSGGPEGTPWRHLFDAYVQHALSARLSVAAQADAGLEPNDVGTSAWVAGALYGKLALSPKVYAALRADLFYEKVAEAAGTTARAIFWPVGWLGSATVTLAYQPAEGVSLRLEYRHDHASDDAFFGGRVEGDGMTTPYVPDRDMQDTTTLGVVAWF